MLDERILLSEFTENNIVDFLNRIEKYDLEMIDIMKAKGYRLLNKSSRTVLFSFGEVTITRNRWYKKGKCHVPVDEYLNLDKYSRYSKELMYKIAKLATYASYRKVVEMIEMLYNIVITKDVVLKACKMAERLLEEKDDYKYFEDENINKKKVEVLYIEGDGVLVKSAEKDSEHRRVDLAHFVIHEGSRKVSKNRFELINKKSFISTSYKSAKTQLIDYIYNTYEITDETLLITNADSGKGYTSEVFKNIAKTFKVKRHEHFIDEYHVNEQIRTAYRNLSQDLKNELFKSIHDADEEKFKAILDTTESIIEDDEKIEGFVRFKDSLIKMFKYIIPAHKRGIRKNGIGIMESQQRKISYRMKNRGMYWSLKGADRMAKMIISVYEGGFRELFFGTWRDDYKKYIEMENVSGFDLLKNINEVNHTVPSGTIIDPKIRAYII